MKIHIHRGQNQIGGSIIEISSDTTRIFFDIGTELDSDDIEKQIPDIEGLFVGEKNCDAVFITHYHADHIGLVSNILDGIPVYMGEKGYEILSTSCRLRSMDVGFVAEFIENRKKITVGDISITPIQCDHSAYDSYMYFVECNGKSVLYTGDFRSSGRLDFQDLLAVLPVADAVICEGTTLSRDDTAKKYVTETELCDIAVSAMKKHSGPCFVILSASNIDRLVTMAEIAKRTKRILCMDLYTALVAKASGVESIDPEKNRHIRVFMLNKDKSDHDVLVSNFNNSKIGYGSIAKSKFILCVRSSMIGYVRKLHNLCSFENGLFFYSLWSGYKEQKGMKALLDEVRRYGLYIHTLHTSGHADAEAISKVIERTSPKKIIPVHTENAKWFDRYSDVCSVIGEAECEV